MLSYGKNIVYGHAFLCYRHGDHYDNVTELHYMVGIF